MSTCRFSGKIVLKIVFAALVAAAPDVKGAQAVLFFGAYVKDPFSQSDSSGAVPGTFFPHQFLAEVVGSELGSYDPRTITFPAGASFPSRQLAVPPSGQTATNSLLFSTQQDLDDATPNGTYMVTLGTETASFDLSAGAAPNAPSIVGGSWSGGKLQVASSGFTLNFVTPMDTDLVRLYIYPRSDSGDTFRYEGDGTTTSFDVLASQIVEGIEYGASLDFINSVDSATAFGGAPGDIGYMARNEFTFVVGPSVPEPSSLLLGFCTCCVFVLRRCR